MDSVIIFPLYFQSDASFENLELLTVEQTLADIATFVRFIREYVGNYEYSRVILYGSGYGGSLAVWAKKRYPSIITAAYASSGSFVLSTYSFSISRNKNVSLINSMIIYSCSTFRSTRILFDAGYVRKGLQKSSSRGIPNS